MKSRKIMNYFHISEAIPVFLEMLFQSAGTAGSDE